MRKAWVRAHVLSTIFFTFVACGPGDATPDGSVDAGIPSSVRIRASEGGSVQSPDGVFTLIVPPNAIAEDTDFSISIVPRDEWPADITVDGSSPIGELYDVQPDGLAFLTPAYGVHLLPVEVPELRTPQGDHRFAVHMMRSADGTIEPASTSTYVTAAGTGVVAELGHLSTHWTQEADAFMHVEGEADGVHRVGEAWTVEDVRLQFGSIIEPAGVVVKSWVVTEGDFYVEPLDHPGWTLGTGGYKPLALVRDLAWFSARPEARSSSRPSDHVAASGWIGTPPLPGWRCVSERDPGTALAVVGGTIYARRRGSNEFELNLHIELGSPSCLAAPTTEQPIADHVVVAETCRLEPTPSGLACGATSGSTVLIQQLSDAERTGCTPLGAGALRCSASSGESERGADPIEIETPGASCTATYDDATRRYVCDIAPDQSIFGAGSDETLTVRATPPGTSTPTTITVTAPDAITPPESVLGPLAGLDTPIQLADGTFDAVFIRAQVASASGPPDDVYVLVPASSMSLAGGVRSTPVLTPELRDAGITELIGDILIGVVRTAADTTLFPEPTLVAAGHAVEVNAADLVPPPEPGDVVTRSCDSLPYLFTPVTGRSFENGLVCLYGDGRCMVTNDLFQDTPLLPSQCEAPNRAISFVGGGVSPSADTGSDWNLPFASTGVGGSRDTTTLPRDGTDEVVIIERISDGARYRIEYNLGAAGLNVSSVAPFTGTLPPWGAKFDAADTPRTFSSPHSAGDALVYVRFCWESSGLFMFGNTDTTPESEVCGSGAFAAALIWTPTLGSSIDPRHPGIGSEWTVESASAGTYSPSGVTMLPTGVDITAVITGVRGRFEMVFRCIPGGFTVSSVRVL